MSDGSPGPARPSFEQVLAELDEFGEPFSKHTGIEHSDRLRKAMATYVAELYKWNDRAALLSRKDEVRVVQRHVMDSLSLLAFLHETEGTTLLDIGAGAGFPGLPLKIAAPELEVALCESVRKKWLFLNHIVEKLDLQRIAVIPERAETAPWRATYPDGFDVVTSRATYQLPELIPLAAPAVKRGGLLVAYKGGRYEDELQRAGQALSRTSLRLVTVWESPWGPGRLLAFQRG